MALAAAQTQSALAEGGDVRPRHLHTVAMVSMP